jgi:hypothetical protein
MKKILSIFIICFWLFSTVWVSNTYANDENKVIKVSTSEKVPWANCECSVKGQEWEKNCTWDVHKYQCNVKTWFGGFLGFMKDALKYITFITWLVGVLYIVVNGILYSTWGIDPSMMDTAKKRIIWTLLGLVLLLLSGPLLTLIAPWIYK